VGENGSGKETFTQLLEGIVGQSNLTHLRTSDLLKETLTMWHVPLTRRNLQEMAIIMDKAYGVGTLSRALLGRVRHANTDIVILDGMRWLSDMELVRSFTPNIVVYITASIEKRYERTKARKEKEGEDKTSFEQFVSEEHIATEVDIKKLAEQADYTIVNDDSLEDFKSKVQEFYDTKLKNL